MPEVSCELIGGPFEGNTGRLHYVEEPQQTLAFHMGDKDDSKLLVPGAAYTDLTAVYVRIIEKPRKVITYDDNGRAHSEKGVRYKYDKELSPCERLFERADQRALLTASAHAQVDATRKLLLEQARARREARA